MNLFIEGFTKDQKYFNEKNIKVVFSGRKNPHRSDVIEAMKSITESSKNNTGGILNICLNYGGKAEIIDSTKKIIRDVIDGKISIDDIAEDLFSSYLYQELPEIDLLIRTSGEIRISNFMIYESAYAEMYFSTVHFPDFKETEYDKTLEEYNGRTIKFGSVVKEDN